jgi:hypothetical protein
MVKLVPRQTTKKKGWLAAEIERLASIVQTLAKSAKEGDPGNRFAWSALASQIKAIGERQEHIQRIYSDHERAEDRARRRVATAVREERSRLLSKSMGAEQFEEAHRTGFEEACEKYDGEAVREQHRKAIEEAARQGYLAGRAETLGRDGRTIYREGFSDGRSLRNAEVTAADAELAYLRFLATKAAWDEGMDAEGMAKRELAELEEAVRNKSAGSVMFKREHEREAAEREHRERQERRALALRGIEEARRQLLEEHPDLDPD